MKLKLYLSKYGVRIAVIVIVAALIAGIASSLLGGRAGVFGSAAGSLRVPLDRASGAVLDWMADLYGYIYEYDRLAEENASLKAENALLREQARDYEELLAENERFRTLFGWAEKRRDLTLESARVVSWDAGNFTSAFSIGKGSDSGIEVGDCVITEYGALAGQIVELGGDWATVRTVIDVDMDVGALAGADSYAGMITGDFALMRQGKTKLGYLTGGAQIFEGDEVLTSGKGGAFPAGLLIGTVSAVMSEYGGQVTYGIVDPACDLERLSQVFIVKDFELVE